MNKKTVTVSIPVYNGEKYILEALQSVVKQIHKVDEIIICDNCSTDSTLDLVKEFNKKHHDFNIIIHRNQTNIGFQNNFKKCYYLASSEFLVILHVDDLLKPDSIKRQLEFFNANPDFAIVAGEVDMIDAEGKLITRNIRKTDKLYRRGEIYEFIKDTASYIPFSTVMYKLKYTNDVDYLSEESVGPDELYWPLLLHKHGIAILGDSLTENRTHHGQMHVGNSIKMFNEYKKHFDNLIAQKNLESSQERIEKTEAIAKQQVSRISINIGNEIFIYKKNLKLALKYYGFGIKKYPGIVFTKFFFRSILSSANLIK